MRESSQASERWGEIVSKKTDRNMHSQIKILVSKRCKAQAIQSINSMWGRHGQNTHVFGPRCLSVILLRIFEMDTQVLRAVFHFSAVVSRDTQHSLRCLACRWNHCYPQTCPFPAILFWTVRGTMLPTVNRKPHWGETRSTSRGLCTDSQFQL